MSTDPTRKKNRLIMAGVWIFALALAALVVILMLLRGPAVVQ